MSQNLLVSSVDQIENFLKSAQAIKLKLEITAHSAKYTFIRDNLALLKYKRLDKGDKHLVLRLLKYFTGYFKNHLKKLVRKWRRGKLSYSTHHNRKKFPRQYGPLDIALIIKTDIAHECLSGQATKEILVRQFKIYGEQNYEHLSGISVSHIYNIRNHNNQYNSSGAKFLRKTDSVQNNLGIRRKPEPNGKPGYLRVDTVHQGDFNGKKGVYHINLVDEVTQYELIATVEGISERFLKPVIIELLALFPFVIYEFHADNGSEYINKYTVHILNKIHVDLTKSRSYHSADNALVESKNGSVVRKMFGRSYIAQSWAPLINQFNKTYVNIYLNYHRPSGFAKKVPDKRGKIKKKYIEWKTPFDKLKSLESAEQYLKDGFTFETLDLIVKEKSDNQFAEDLRRAKSLLFKKINRH